MFAFIIEENEIKVFMDKLFRQDCFDRLEIRTVELETIVKYEISGSINKEYLNENEERFFAKWSEIKGYVFQLIKGHKKPKYLRLVFSLDDGALKALDENAAAAFLNLSYENNRVTGTTGTSQKGFSLDKSLDISWEDMIKRFFKKNEIIIKAL